MSAEVREASSSVASLSLEFQTASGINISGWTVCQELCEMGFNDQAVARKSSITMLNVKHLLEWLHAATGL